MKARLIRYYDSNQLLLSNGKIKNLSYIEACDFILNFDNPEYYAGDGKWDSESLPMEEFHGDSIAYVDENDTLHVVNSELFRMLFENKESNYITVPEYATLHNKKPAIVRRFCQNGRIIGAIQKGNTWLIPANSPYPQDERVKY